MPHLRMSPEEANALVDRIRRAFDKYVARYDESKYPSGVYSDLVAKFETPASVTRNDIDDALRWKYGHFAKGKGSNIPAKHSHMMAHVARVWPQIFAELTGDPKADFEVLNAAIVAGRLASQPIPQSRRYQAGRAGCY